MATSMKNKIDQPQNFFNKKSIIVAAFPSFIVWGFAWFSASYIAKVIFLSLKFFEVETAYNATKREAGMLQFPKWNPHEK